MGTRSEAAFQEWAEPQGWGDLCQRGWPDFWGGMPSGEFAAVEVKRYPHEKLRSEQSDVIFNLLGHGIRCFLWCWQTKQLTELTRDNLMQHTSLAGL